MWNLSLGAEAEVHPNFISPEAAVLDRLQCEYDVQFVVAGTNLGRQEGPRRIGAPADSINSIVVNAVGADGRPARYHRTGPVLKFFSKPDVRLLSDRRAVCSGNVVRRTLDCSEDGLFDPSYGV